MRLSACIDIMMQGLNITEKLLVVQEAGIPAFEFWGWENKDLDDLERAARESNLEVATFCTRFVSLVDPEERDKYLEGLQATISVAKRLGCNRLITQTGAELPDVSRQTQIDSLVAGLQACVPMLVEHDMTLL